MTPSEIHLRATGSTPGEPPDGGAPTAPAPQLLCDVRALTEPADNPAGALWKLAEDGRQLDANVIHLPPGQRVGTHAEPDLDVLLLVVAGDGVLDTAEGRRPLTEGALFWLPHGSSRSLSAGEGGLSYLTVHRRRPGLQIRRPDRPAAPSRQPGTD
ncbi:cupin domain-containing protein [Streptomyces sp. NPDC007264]|uniref:cupin domain-containing protein n=1 Tax=Streptomyces sp. NPDC007264 TaxID=3364777 RepID=UPI0036D9E41D